MIIDSHLHVWDRRRAAYAWLGPDVAAVDRDIELDEVVPQLEESGVTGVVLVQSADEPGDTDNMLEVAEANHLVLGVVGWVPLEHPREAERRLDLLRENPRIVGIRNLIHDRSDPDWALRPDFGAGLALLEDVGLPFDFVTGGPDALARLLVVADRHPRLRIVLDHLGKPPLSGSSEALAGWEARIRELATRPNVVAKVSGLYASSDPAEGWTVPRVAEAAGVAFDAFGPERVMYGGDWPMSTMAGGYRRVFEAISSVAAHLSESDRGRFFSGNAARFYGLVAPEQPTLAAK